MSGSLLAVIFGFIVIVSLSLIFIVMMWELRDEYFRKTWRILVPIFGFVWFSALIYNVTSILVSYL